MLTKSDALADILIPVKQETAYRVQHGEAVETRFKLIIDSPRSKKTGRFVERVIAARTDRFDLLPNREILSAVDLKADELGIGEFTPVQCAYRRGWSTAVLELPNASFKVPGDKSPVTPTLIMLNDYRGWGSLSFEIGLYRVVCTNGMRIGVEIARMRKRHVKSASEHTKGDLLDFVAIVLQKMQDKVEVARLIAETASSKRVTKKFFEQEFLPAIVEGTARRHHEALAVALDEYTNNLGMNAWALTQAISDVQRHTLGDNRTALSWRDRWINRVLSELNVFKSAKV